MADLEGEYSCDAPVVDGEEDCKGRDLDDSVLLDFDNLDHMKYFHQHQRTDRNANAEDRMGGRIAAVRHHLDKRWNS